MVTGLTLSQPPPLYHARKDLSSRYFILRKSINRGYPQPQLLLGVDHVAVDA